MISSSKIDNRVQPYGNGQFTTGGQIIKLIIEKTDRAFLNPATMYLNFNVELGAIGP